MENGLRVFVVDDDEIILDILSDILHDDCQVETFTSGEACQTRLTDLKPDMFLMDVNMPGMVLRSRRR